MGGPGPRSGSYEFPSRRRMDPTVEGDVVSVLSVVPTGAVGAARLPQFEEPCTLEALVGPHPSVGRERVAFRLPSPKPRPGTDWWDLHTCLLI